MRDLFVIADDLTGALDAAVPFASTGAKVEVSLSTVGIDDFLIKDWDVLSVCAGTRHLCAADSARVVSELSGKAVAAGIPVILKKTDSGLRGNVGAELEAMWRKTGSHRLHFIPAFPETGRTMKGGIQYVGDIPVSESMFGSDPFDPVRHDFVNEIIAEQTSIPTCNIPEGGQPNEDFSGIAVYDSTTQSAVELAVRTALQDKAPHALAGCGGIAKALVNAMGFFHRSQYISKEGNVLVFCGSVNSVSFDQVQCAKRAGAPVFFLSSEACNISDWVESTEGKELVSSVCKSWATHALTVMSSVDTRDANRDIDSSSVDRAIVAKNLGAILGAIARQYSAKGTVVAMGGDILLSFLTNLGTRSLFPLGEIAPGVVASHIKIGDSRLELVSKSGGFGEKNLFLQIAKEKEGKGHISAGSS